MRILLAMLVAVCVSGVALGQDSIVLRGSATIDAARDVVLADVAELSGDEAQKHKGVVVVEASRTRALEAGGSVALDVQAVRGALSKAGVRWARVSLSGGTCTVRLGKVERVEPAPAAKPDGPLVRDHVIERLAAHYAVPTEDIRLTFDADRSGLLDQSTRGRTVAVTPMGASDRTPVTIRVYDGGTLVAEGSAKAQVLVRRSVTIARRKIARGARIDALEVAEEERWVSPSAHPASALNIVGGVARGAIAEGATIGARDVETPALVRKGDLVAVDSVVGGVVVRMNNARALMDGREGDEILVEQAASLASTEKAAGRRGKPGTVRVKVCGAGRATVVHAGAKEAE